MKRLYIIQILICMASMNASADIIVTDRIESDGAHQIMTATKNFNLGSAKYMFGLKMYDKTYSKDWVLLVSSYNYIPESSEILLKLGNDDIVYLKANNVNVGKIHKPGYGYVIGNVVATQPTHEVNYYVSLYEISTDLLDRIELHGIKKVRISDGVEYRDKEFKKNALGKHLIKSYKAILKRLSTSPMNNDLFDNF